MIETLPPKQIPGRFPSGIGTVDHPMRLMTRRIAGLEPGEWDRDAQCLVTETFDALASDWHTRTSPERTAIVEDALVRGLDPLVAHGGLAVEIGSGIGTYSPLLADRFGVVASVELSREMLVRAEASSHRVQGDGAMLPIRDDSVNAIVLINAFLFPREASRVLKRGGVLIWVCSSGDQTPIYLSHEDVQNVLPFPVHGLASGAGAGTWCALVRDS